MSLLIRGMEMPGSCSKCPMRYRTLTQYDFCAALEETIVGIHLKQGRLKDCPLVEVPTPHGRLTDADALAEKIWQARVQYQMLDDTQTADKIMYGIYRVEQILAEAPTIIEEEGEGENG